MLQVKLVPVVYDTATGSTSLYRRLQLRVAYTTGEPIGVVDSGLTEHRLVPGQAGTAWADVVNASDAPVEVATETILRDTTGHQVGRTTGGPFTVAGGTTSRLFAPLPPTQVEGGFTAVVRVLRGGSELSAANGGLHATAGFISGLKAPSFFVPGGKGSVDVTYANTTAAATEVELAVAILSESGLPVETLPKQKVVVPATGEAAASFIWDARSAALGRYQVRVTATPAGGIARSSTRVVDVRAGRTVRRHLGSGG